MTLPTWRTLAIIAAAVAVVLLLGVGGWLWTSAEQQRGMAVYAETLARARQRPDAGTEGRMQAIRDLETVLAEYPSNAMAPQAAYELGNLRFAAHEYDKARAAYQVTIAKASGGTLGTLARVGIGSAWETERKFLEAIQAYQTALADLKPTAFYYEELLIDLARAQQLAGRNAEAVTTYRRILKDLPKSARADDVRNLMANLGVSP